MKILIIEDTVTKYVAIRRVLEDLFDAQIDHEKVLESAKERFANEPYDIVITDMHFPLERGGREVSDAGVQMIEYIQERRPEQPVIICSSVRYLAEGVAGSVLYSEKTDLRLEFSRIICENI